MSDIIDRLRGPAPSIMAMRDGADEIQHLRFRLKAAQEEVAEVLADLEDARLIAREKEDQVIAANLARDSLADEVRRLREALGDARNNGLIYWEPRTSRGAKEKARMLSRIDAILNEVANG